MPLAPAPKAFGAGEIDAAHGDGAQRVESHAGRSLDRDVVVLRLIRQRDKTNEASRLNQLQPPRCPLTCEKVAWRQDWQAVKLGPQ